MTLKYHASDPVFFQDMTDMMSSIQDVQYPRCPELDLGPLGAMSLGLMGLVPYGSSCDTYLSVKHNTFECNPIGLNNLINVLW